MALLTPNSIKRISKDRVNIHKKVDATYTVFKYKGKTYFQLDTYGSRTREMKGKISQTILFDEETAGELLKLIEDAFDIS